jgi:hypothetical protein
MAQPPVKRPGFSEQVGAFLNERDYLSKAPRSRYNRGIDRQSDVSTKTELTVARLNRTAWSLCLFVAGALFGVLGDRLFTAKAGGSVHPEQAQSAPGGSKYFDDPLGLDKDMRSTTIGPPKDRPSDRRPAHPN